MGHTNLETGSLQRKTSTMLGFPFFGMGIDTRWNSIYNKIPAPWKGTADIEVEEKHFKDLYGELCLLVLCPVTIDRWASFLHINSDNVLSKEIEWKKKALNTCYSSWEVYLLWCRTEGQLDAVCCFIQSASNYVILTVEGDCPKVMETRNLSSRYDQE